MGIDVIPLTLSPHVVTMTVAVGIDPSIDLNAPLMSLLNQILKGVKRWSHASSARDITGPRLIGGVIHCVAHCPDVVINRVHVVHAQRVEHLATGILHDGCVTLRDGTTGPIIQVGCNPHASLLALGRNIGCDGKTGDKRRQ